MGEIADMMLDGTMDPETGEWNFDGEDGPGFPMTGAEASEYRRATGWCARGSSPSLPETPIFKVTKALRKRVQAFGELVNHNAYHWQVRKSGKVVADWWPHKRKFRFPNEAARSGDETAFLKAIEAIAKATSPSASIGGE